MANIVFKRNPAFPASLMQSDSVRGVLRGRAGGIVAQCRSAIAEDKGTPLYEEPYKSFDFTTHDRAGVRVQTHNRHADYAERKYGILQNAAGV